ncbi:MAG TPA: glycogen/starch/alpha-glucan phosphorylase [Kaistiaceae bacterium]|nr:glycogen/starch/alpha-glucan phosphorylase [Kaistiaceae bacterium]
MSHTERFPLPHRAADEGELRKALLERLVYSVGKDPEHAVPKDWCTALTLVVRDYIIDRWMPSTRRVYDTGQKRVYYFSMEFMIGRLLVDSMCNLGIEDECRAAIESFGLNYGEIVAYEADAALGNGGLGRLAACFMDSMSTLGIAAHGYGIRYEHGLFKQRLADGWQIEEAEDWLISGHHWEFERPEVAYEINFGGRVEVDGEGRAKWRGDDRVIAAAYDTPIVGWRGRHVNTLRLWSAKPTHLIDFDSFNRGEFLHAAEQAVLAQTISRVLYPNDATPKGRELRLKQEYFFTSASLQDLLRRYVNQHGDLRRLHEHVAIQMNDTHPAIAVAELVRLMVDEHDVSLEQAFLTVRNCIGYTNHTLLPEALERWPVDMFRRILPRHLQIIEWLDEWQMREVQRMQSPVPFDAVRIIDHANGGSVRMGNLAFLGSRRINGVSALHTALMKETVFYDLSRLYPERIVNETNGITPRRWLYQCNRPLRKLLIEAIGDRWVGDLEQIEDIRPFSEDAEFRHRFSQAKRQNKQRLITEIQRRMGLTVDPNAMFDIQIKRIHEYKRQLLNLLETVARYFAIRNNPGADWTPRVKLFAGKAAPSYVMAKYIIKLANDIAQIVNHDPVVGDRLKVAFLQNYNVSLAELMIPAADLSEQISTAGMEASGTGNMKLSLNGALTIGTLDGANVEIRDRVGDENIFIFGLTAADVNDIRARGFDSRSTIESDPLLTEVLSAIESGYFSPDDPGRYRGLVDKLRHDDYFLVTADFRSYVEKQKEVDASYVHQDEWLRKAVINTAQVGWFSSDRTIRGYAHDIWRVPIGTF